MNKKTVTIVISSFHYGHLAAHCIESVLSQTHKPDKILFVDDGVGDCFYLKDLYPEVDFFFRKKNLGTVANFDDMLYKVKTDMCMFLGADNWLRSDTLEILMKEDADVVMYDVIVTGVKKDEIFDNYNSQMTTYQGDYYWYRTNKHHGSMLYSTKLAQKFGYKRHDKGKYTAEDLVLWNNMVKAGATLKHIPEGLLFYRRHKENFNKYGKYYKPKFLKRVKMKLKKILKL